MMISGATMFMINKKVFYSVELEIEESDDDDEQRRDVNLRRSHFLQNYPEHFPEQNIVRTMEIHFTGPANEIHNLPKKQSTWFQYIKQCVIRESWYISQFFLNYIFSYFSIIFITGCRIRCNWIHRKFSIRKKCKYDWRASDEFIL